MKNNKRSVDQVTQEILKNYSTENLGHLMEFLESETGFIVEHNQLMYGWTFRESQEFIENITLAYKMLSQGLAA